MNEITIQALSYRQKGYSVIPLGDIYLDEKGDKKVEYPVSWAEFQKRLPSEEEIKDWFEVKKYKNVGIITGKISNLFVLDTDSYKETYDKELVKSFSLPPTPCQTTGRGGKQYFFKYSGNAVNAVGVFTKDSGVDIRANGGMVIVPPSRLRTAKNTYSEYAWDISLDDMIPEPLPENLAERFEDTKKEKTDWDEFFEAQKNSGIRNMSAAKLAGKILYETSPEMWDVLGISYFRQWNRDFNKPPLSEKELISTWKSIKKKHIKNNEPPEPVSLDFSEDEKEIIRIYKKDNKKGTYYLAKHITKIHSVVTIGEKNLEMYVYKNGIYVNAENEIIYPEIQRILTDGVTRASKGETFSKIAHMTPYPRSVFDSAKINLIPLNKGTYNIDTKEFLEHIPDNKFTYKFPVEYNPLAECPHTLETIHTILNPDQVTLFQEWVGYYFYRRYLLKKALIIVGVRDSGKTTLLELITHLIGRDNMSGVTLQKMTSDKFAAAHLYGKHGNIVDELSAKDITDTGNFKVATGGGSITGEYKFGNQFSFHNFSKLTFACNVMPSVKDMEDDDAYFGRWMVIHLENPIKNFIPDYIERLKTEEERSGFFNWAMKGLDRVLENKKFSYNLTPEEVKNEMLRSGSSIAVFAANCIKHEQGNEITKADMYDQYTKYCQINKISTQTMIMFGSKLLGYVKYASECRISIPGKSFGKTVQAEAWRNVRIILTEEEEGKEKNDEVLLDNFAKGK